MRQFPKIRKLYFCYNVQKNSNVKYFKRIYSLNKIVSEKVRNKIHFIGLINILVVKNERKL